MFIEMKALGRAIVDLNSFCNNVKVQNNGDYAIFNKQPSLQKMSLMEFKANKMLDLYTIKYDIHYIGRLGASQNNI